MLPAVLGGTTNRAANRLANMSLRRLGISLAVVAIAASGLFGGLEKAEPESAPSIGIDTAVEAGPWKVTVKRAQLHGDLPPMVLSDKANRWLVVVATVEIIDNTTWNTPTAILRVSDVSDLTSPLPQVMLLRDASRIGRLHPGMPEDVVFFWEQAASAPIPKQVTVQVMGRTHRKNSLRSSRSGLEWLDEAPHALVSVNIQDKRVAK